MSISFLMFLFTLNCFIFFNQISNWWLKIYLYFYTFYSIKLELHYLCSRPNNGHSLKTIFLFTFFQICTISCYLFIIHFIALYPLSLSITHHFYFLESLSTWIPYETNFFWKKNLGLFFFLPMFFLFYHHSFLPFISCN